MLLSQSYANQLTIQVTRRQKNDYQNIIGTIPTLSTNEVILKTSDGHIAIALADIIAITLVEEATMNQLDFYKKRIADGLLQ